MSPSGPNDPNSEEPKDEAAPRPPAFGAPLNPLPPLSAIPPKPPIGEPTPPQGQWPGQQQPPPQGQWPGQQPADPAGQSARFADEQQQPPPQGQWPGQNDPQRQPPPQGQYGAPGQQQPGFGQNPYGQPQQPYGNQQSWPPPAGQPGFQPQMYPETVKASEILIMSIVAFFCCGLILGPYSIIKSNAAIAAIDAGRMDPKDRGTLTTARICGIIATVLNVIVFIARMAMVGNSLSHH